MTTTTTMTGQPACTNRLRIGELAGELGLNPKTIRYYEEIGLLPEAPRTSSGYRLYNASDLERLRFIGKAKRIGLSLEEIREILEIDRDGRQPCEHVLGLLDQKLAAVDQQMRALRDFRRELIDLREEAATTMTADACVCGIIEQHAPGARTEPAWGASTPVLAASPSLTLARTTRTGRTVRRH